MATGKTADTNDQSEDIVCPCTHVVQTSVAIHDNDVIINTQEMDRIYFTGLSDVMWRLFIWK